jgi:hypothetical protein
MRFLTPLFLAGYASVTALPPLNGACEILGECFISHGIEPDSCVSARIPVEACMDVLDLLAIEPPGTLEAACAWRHRTVAQLIYHMTITSQHQPPLRTISVERFWRAKSVWALNTPSVSFHPNTYFIAQVHTPFLVDPGMSLSEFISVTGTLLMGVW